MNKSELVSAVTSTSGTSKGDAARAVDAVCDVITEALSRGEEVRLTGFGRFVLPRGRDEPWQIGRLGALGVD